MSGFVRAAPWLRQLFTSSRTSQANPTTLSDDVSLIQPYDGGGFPLFDPGQWAVTIDSAAVAAATTNLLTVPAGNIARLIAVSAAHVAGVAPTVFAMARVPSLNELAITAQVTLSNVERFNLPLQCPILIAGQQLQGRHFGGNAATVVRWVFLHVLAPLGTNFTV